MPPPSTLEVWDMNRDNVASWDVLPNNRYRKYELLSHAILNGLIYFVFDYGPKPKLKPDRGFCTKVLTFDPKLRQWATCNDDTTMMDEDEDDEYDEDEEDVRAYDMLSLYVDFSARRHEGGVNVVEFFKDDPSRGRFCLIQLVVTAMPPCFYSYDRWSFDPKTMVNVVREFWPPCVSDIDRVPFLNWFQIFVRPYLSSVTGFSRMVEILKMQRDRARNCFVLPCSYEHNCWTFCFVACIQCGSGDSMASVAKFRLRLQKNNSFHAEDFQMHSDFLPDTTNIPLSLSRIP